MAEVAKTAVTNEVLEHKMTRTLLRGPLSYPNYVQSNDTLHWLAWRKFAQNLWRQRRIWITWQRVESKRSLDIQNTQKI